MFDSSNALTREYYTVNLSGLIAHAMDVVAHGRAASLRMALERNELPRSRVGPLIRSHGELGVPQSVRVR